jgi:uncharacterized membrane-anchored protein
MRLTKNQRFFLAICLQVFLLLGIIGYHYGRTLGNRVLLRIRPYDPTAPLRGDYLAITCDISSLPSSLFDYSPVKEGDVVYVRLEEGKDFARPISGKAVSRNRPTKGVFIRGVLTKSGSAFLSQLPTISPDDQHVQITYGIESYFVPEGSGRNLRWNGRDYAVIALDRDGNATLTTVYVDGKPVK